MSVTSLQQLPGPRLRLPYRRFSLFASALISSLLLGSLEGCHAQQPWPLWEAYTKNFVDTQGRVIDHGAQDRTTSEGQAYALFFALVDNDRAHFAQVLSWTEANLAQGDLTQHLPAWSWGHAPDGAWKIQDANSASDADLWLAYSLLEGGRLWHNTRYLKLGQLVAARIAREEVALVPGVGTTLIPGPRGFHPSEQTYLVNPSYAPLPLITYLAATLPEGPWQDVLRSLPRLYAPGIANGFAMDWLLAGTDGIAPARLPTEPASGPQSSQPIGSYDAIRVYLWLGLSDRATPGASELLEGVHGMAAYLRTAVTPPLAVDASGTVLQPASPPGFSASVIPYLEAVGMKAQADRQADRLAATRRPESGLYGQAPTYYDQNLTLFSTGWSENRFRFDHFGRLSLKWK